MPKYANVTKFKSKEEVRLYKEYCLTDLAEMTQKITVLTKKSDKHIHEYIVQCKKQIKLVENYIYNDSAINLLSARQFDAVYHAYIDNKEILRSLEKEQYRRTAHLYSNLNKRLNNFTQYETGYDSIEHSKRQTKSGDIGVLHGVAL